MKRALLWVCLVGCGGGGSTMDMPPGNNPLPDGGKNPSMSDSGMQTGNDASEMPDVSVPTQIGNYGPKDKPDFKTPDELCAYVNQNRKDYQPHDRFKGPPWSGSYHMNTTWPLTLTIDSALMAEAQMRASALANGMQPQGQPYSDGQPPPHDYLWITGVDSAHYVIQTQEKPGDWTSDLVGNIHAGITPSNGTSRMAMFYHDPGGAGPVLSKIGCGGAQSPGGSSWWWVVVMGQ